MGALLVAGCQKATDKGAPKENAAPKGGQEHGPAAKSAETEKPAALTAEDRALIEKQKVCPVTGQALGSMGEPVKVVVKGQTVFLCCDSCKAAIEKDPDKYLAKLKK
jgi:YHS domain-containing protein